MTEQNKEKKEIKKGLKAIWRHMQPFKPQLTVMVFLGVISAVANGFVPYITGRFFDALIAVSEHKTTFISSSLPTWALFLGVWFVVQFVANNIDWIMDRMRRKVDMGVHFDIQTNGFVHMFRLPLSYHSNARSNGELQKISTVSWRVSEIIRTVTEIAPQFLSIIIGIVLAASINHLLAGVLLVGVILYVALLVKILLPIAAIDSLAHKSWNESWEDAAASVQQIESVKQATGEEYEIKKVRKNLLGATKDLWLRLERNWSNIGFFQRIIVFLTQFVVFAFSVHLISTGAITVGQLVALNGYAMMFFGPFVSLGYSWQTIQNGVTSAAQAEEIFEKEEEIYIPNNSVSLEHLSGDVNFKNVSFCYGPEQPVVLDDINVDVKAGQVVALVGESGVGKSTAISLISGYHFPTKGSVEIDGVDTRRLDLTKLRQQIAVVPQEVALFNDTILANIRYGSFDAPLEDVMRVAKEAHIDEFVSALPEKYETLVGERGIKLSVGQKQRVAIARAMLRDPAILILDEPTSALDAQTEKIITEELEKLMRGRTTFIIAHRLSTVRKADVIFVFQKGKIAETGSHQELIEREGGLYRRFYEYQIGLH
jgi:ABC-type multidrug transport system fused ATPase/permease subunit